METQIQIKIDSSEKEIIRQASKKLSLGCSTFTRVVALREAKRILESENARTTD